MKKAFTAIAVLALTIGAASALGFSWGTNTKISFNGTVLDSADLAAPVTAELIYLGKDNAWSFDKSGLVTDEVVNTGSIATTGAPTGKGKANGKLDKLVGESFADGSTLGNGNVFGVLITYTGRRPAPPLRPNRCRPTVPGRPSTLLGRTTKPAPKPRLRVAAGGTFRSRNR